MISTETLMPVYEEYDVHSGNIAELENIIAVSNETGVQMLPLYEAKIKTHKGAVIAKLGNEVIGYCAITFDYGNTAEVGGLTVPKEYRRHGIGNGLVQSVTEKAHSLGKNAIAFCNPSSASLFEKNGYYQASYSEVPKEALKQCSACTMKDLHKNGVCCDKVYLNKVF